MTPTQRAAMEHALEKLKAIASGEDYGKLTPAIDAVGAALAEQPAEQVPVAWMSPGKERLEFSRKDTVYGSHTIPLYTAPQPAIPPEFKLVPVEPTSDMQDAGWRCQPESDELLEKLSLIDTYRAMLNAAPEAPVQQDAQAASQGDDFSQCKPPMRHIPGVRVDLLRKAATAAPTPPAPAVEGETK